MSGPVRLALAMVLAAAPAGARAQTMLDQEQRLIEIHSLLLDLPPLQGPGALAAWQWNLGLEIITVPEIDGTTGSKVQLTASDRTSVFPRPRLTLGLPAPEGFRAFAGVAYVPPIEVRDASTNLIAAEAGFAYVPDPFRVGIRAHALYAYSVAPVTDPATRDTLETSEYGVELSAAWAFAVESAGLDVVPYAGAGIVGLHGRFRVTSDGYVLESDYTGASLNAGVRLVLARRWEGVAEVDWYPDRLVHPSFKLGYVFP
ncbi:MAG TPA: hypothetical protein VFR85_08450 [Anaeromyxobacteraceae bacterium]|nr:hypothetical protein [Anaeromyxobacteraceae bacterium]